MTEQPTKNEPTPKKSEKMTRYMTTRNIYLERNGCVQKVPMNMIVSLTKDESNHFNKPVVKIQAHLDEETGVRSKRKVSVVNKCITKDFNDEDAEQWQPMT